MLMFPARESWIHHCMASYLPPVQTALWTPSFIGWAVERYRPNRPKYTSPYTPTSRLKIGNRSFFHSAPVLWNSFTSDLSHDTLLITSLLHLY